MKKVWAHYWNPVYDLSVVFVFRTPPDTPHYHRAMAALTLWAAVLTIGTRVLVR